MIKKINPQKTHEIRLNVLGKNIPNYPFEYQGDSAESTFHLGYFEDEKLLGILTVMKTSAKEFQFRGMAVSESVQNKKIGKKLLNFAEKMIAEDAEIIWLNAREKVVSFYEKSGFKKTGNLFMIAPIGLHIKMIKQSKKTR